MRQDRNVYRVSLWQPTVFFRIAASCLVHHSCICKDTEEFEDICLISVRKGKEVREYGLLEKWAY